MNNNKLIDKYNKLTWAWSEIPLLPEGCGSAVSSVVGGSRMV